MNLWNFLRRTWVSLRRLPSSINAWMSGIIFHTPKNLCDFFFKIYQTRQLRLFYNLGTERCDVFYFYTSLFALFLVRLYHIVYRTFLLLTKVFLHKGKQVAEIREPLFFSISIDDFIFGRVFPFGDYT